MKKVDVVGWLIIVLAIILSVITSIGSGVKIYERIKNSQPEESVMVEPEVDTETVLEPGERSISYTDLVGPWTIQRIYTIEESNEYWCPRCLTVRHDKEFTKLFCRECALNDGFSQPMVYIGRIDLER